MPSLPDTGCPFAGSCPLHLPRLTHANRDGIGIDLSVSTLEHPFLDTYINNSRWEETNEATPSRDEWAEAPAE
jgi:hypothetical protein